MRRPLSPLVPLGVAAAVVVVAILMFSSGGGHPAHRAQAAGGSSGEKQRPHPAPPRIVHGRHHDPVPILMYHVISSPQPGAPYPGLYTPTDVFRAQMRALAQRGYHGVTLAQVDRYWRRGYALPRRPVVVSFDDGYLSHYTHALPVLRRLGWPGVLNLEVHNAVTKGDLSIREVRALVGAGWEVDSHTVDHPDLTTLSPDRLRYELEASRAFIRRHFGVPADYFCYPAGRFDSGVVAAVRAAGYLGATTTQPGLATPSLRFTQPRIRVEGQDGVSGLLAKLAHPATAAGSSTGE